MKPSFTSLLIFTAFFFPSIPISHAEELKDDINLTKKIRALILKKSSENKEGMMKGYRAKIPITGAQYDMVAIKGGEFLMGSPPNEQHREKDEGPQRKIKVDPFWMGKFEITWDQFEPFILTDWPRTREGVIERLPKNPPLDLVVSAPTTPYMDMSFGMGWKGFPAVCMTQHAASKFCQWLSAQTGHYYRLPTEAEWEYACRAGTNTAFSFGNDINKLKEYAVFDANQYAKVGSKKPNPWGLYDMHGNVLEWCLDQYHPTAYSGKIRTIPATNLYPRVIRGGSWYDYAEDGLMRSAARLHSEKDYKMSDPQLPRSLWYLTDADWLGFRIVRPLAIPSAKKMDELWNSGKIDDK